MNDLTAALLSLLLMLPAIVVLGVLIGRRLGEARRAAALFVKAWRPARNGTSGCRAKLCGNKLDACPT